MKYSPSKAVNQILCQENHTSDKIEDAVDIRKQVREQINDIDEEMKKVDSTLSEFCEVICTDYKSLVDSTDQMRMNMAKMREEKT